MLTIIRVLVFSQVKSTEDTLHFDDGVNRIDMILVYPDKYAKKTDRTSGLSSESPMINEEYDGDNENHRIEEREYFERNLRVLHGLKTETASSTRNKETTHFVKISAPWRVLSKYAEILKFRMPIQVFGK